MKDPCQLNWLMALDALSTSAFIADSVFDCCFTCLNGFDKDTNEFIRIFLLISYELSSGTKLRKTWKKVE